MVDALIIFAILIVLLFARLPVGFAMAGVGIVGFAYYVGWPGTFAMIGRIAFDTPQRAEFAVVPLFVLMGNFIARAGLADELYAAAYAWIGHRRGGLAMATIVSCGGWAIPVPINTRANIFGRDDSINTRVKLPNRLS